MNYSAGLLVINGVLNKNIMLNQSFTPSTVVSITGNHICRRASYLEGYNLNINNVANAGLTQ